MYQEDEISLKIRRTAADKITLKDVVRAQQSGLERRRERSERREEGTE